MRLAAMCWLSPPSCLPSLCVDDKMNTAAPLLWICLLVGWFGQRLPLTAQGLPLHQRIDQRFSQTSLGKFGQCSDAEYLRRVSLDLIGMPPTADQTRQFIADSAPNKRAMLVAQLLSSPHYARHQASMLELMLMERRANTHVTAEEWQAWLLAAVRDNKPWNLLAKELLVTDGAEPSSRPASRFFLDRTAEPHLLTRDIGRVFFGRDLQCAQCHDHPLVKDYLQADYHGLLAFVSTSYTQILKEGEKEKTVLAEKAGAELAFESVFEGVPHRTGPRLPDLLALNEAFLLPGEEYQVPPADNVQAIPAFSRRAKMAELATNGTNRAFNENIVNRLWAQMLGRGLVHPVDWHHADNPASDPELLQLLADQFAAMNYDMRSFLGELALTEVYQRSFDTPQDSLALADKARETCSAIESQLVALDAQATASTERYATATDAWYAAEAIAIPVAKELDVARNAYAELRKKQDDATAALTTATSKLNTQQQLESSLQQSLAALQLTSQLLPSDTEIADAVQKLQAKSQAATTEIATVQPTIEPLTVAQTAAIEATRNAKPALEASLAKLTPFSDAVRAAEDVMLQARRQSAIDSGAFLALRGRLETSQRIAKLPELQQAIAAAEAQAAQLATAVSVEQTNLASTTALLHEKAQVLQQLTTGLEAAQQAASLAQAELARRNQESQSLVAAVSATETALAALPGDETLVEVLGKLQNRLAASQMQIGQSQQAVDAADALLQDSLALRTRARQALEGEQAACTLNQQALDTASATLALAQSTVSQRQADFVAAQATLDEHWSRDFTMAVIKPLTPEQLCWTVFRVTGVYDNYWAVEVAELDKATPLTEEQKLDNELLRNRQWELEQRVYDKLKGNIPVFVAFYGAAAGQPQSDFFSTADQALFAANGSAINSWVAPAGDNVTQRMIQQVDLQLAAEELYLAILTRLPSIEEKQDIVNYLSPRIEDKPVAVQELVWALLNSAEFRFNY